MGRRYEVWVDGGFMVLTPISDNPELREEGGQDLHKGEGETPPEGSDVGVSWRDNNGARR